MVAGQKLENYFDNFLLYFCIIICPMRVPEITDATSHPARFEFFCGDSTKMFETIIIRSTCNAPRSRMLNLDNFHSLFFSCCGVSLHYIYGALLSGQYRYLEVEVNSDQWKAVAGNVPSSASPSPPQS